VNQPHNWSQVQMRAKGEASVMRLKRDPKICDRGKTRNTQCLLDNTRQPVAVIGNPPPLRTFAKRRSALFLRALPLSRARS
jgi:hypothetical protein